MIFSTVRAPHDPALTVESLAIRRTGRPSTRAAPVITPSAGRPSASALANRPSSTNESGSTSAAIRSRANSLPRAAFASWYRSAPPASTRLRSSSSPIVTDRPPSATDPAALPERSLGYHHRPSGTSSPRRAATRTEPQEQGHKSRATRAGPQEQGHESRRTRRQQTPGHSHLCRRRSREVVSHSRADARRKFISVDQEPNRWRRRIGLTTVTCR